MLLTKVDEENNCIVFPIWGMDSISSLFVDPFCLPKRQYYVHLLYVVLVKSFTRRFPFKYKFMKFQNRGKIDMEHSWETQ